MNSQSVNLSSLECYDNQLVNFKDIISSAFDRMDECIEEIHEKFDDANSFISEQDEILDQLNKQHEYCNGLLSTFENFIISFSQIKPDDANCNQLFGYVSALKSAFQDFTVNGNFLTEKLNNKMEDQFNQFIELKNESEMLNDDPTEINEMCDQFDHLYQQLEFDEDRFNEIENYIEMEKEEQRFIISQFILAMFHFCCLMDSAVISNNLIHFNYNNAQQFGFYNNRQFLRDLAITCQNIQII